jgi:large subunit ribosomal protein L40e
MSFSVIVNSLTERATIDSLHAHSTIEMLKQKLFEQLAIPTCQQRLMFGGRSLEDKQTLADAGINNEATLVLVIKLPPKPVCHSPCSLQSMLALLYSWRSGCGDCR